MGWDGVGWLVGWIIVPKCIVISPALGVSVVMG